MVCNIGGQLGMKVVISALGMLALYMRFNGTGIWGGETIYHSDLRDYAAGVHLSDIYVWGMTIYSLTVILCISICYVFLTS